MMPFVFYVQYIQTWQIFRINTYSEVNIEKEKKSLF